MSTFPDPPFTELGCFNDDHVDDFRLQWDVISQSRTPETCIFYCYNAGRRYAGAVFTWVVHDDLLATRYPHPSPIFNLYSSVVDYDGNYSIRHGRNGMIGRLICIGTKTKPTLTSLPDGFLNNPI